MARKQKNKQDAREKQWENEAYTLRKYRENALKKKEYARSKGYTPVFFDYLDSFVEEFKRIGERAKVEFFPYLFDVLETDEEMVRRDSWSEFGIPADWQLVTYNFDRDGEGVANNSVDAANPGGVVHTFRTAENELRLLVLIKKTVRTNVLLAELKYGAKIGTLLHELGHVKDIIEGRYFNTEKCVAEPLNAEVSANRYALEQCQKYGYRMSFDNLVAHLRRETTGFRGEVSAKLFATCDLTPPPFWEDCLP